MRKLLTISGAILTLFMLISAAGCQADRAGRIVFLGRIEGQRDQYIYSMNPDGSDRVKLAPWNPRMMPYHSIWSAGGKTLAYMDSDNDSDRYWLAVVDGDGQNRRRLLEMTDLKPHSIAMSPDGKTVVLSLDSTRVSRIETPQGGTVHVEITENYDKDLFTVDVKTGKLKRLTDTPDVKELWPSYSPNGKLISFIGQIDTENLKGVPQEVYVMDADGSNRIHLAHHAEGVGFHFAELRWSPDGTKIAYSYLNVFVGDSEDYYDIFVIDVKKGNVTNITQSPYIVDSEPEWSPDSRKIAINSGALKQPYRFRTIIMDIYDGSATELDQGLSSWTPDGKGLIFVNPLNVFELMVADADGKNPRSLAVSKDIRISRPFWLSE